MLLRWQSAVDFTVLAAALYVLLVWGREARALRTFLGVLALRVGDRRRRAADVQSHRGAARCRARRIRGPPKTYEATPEPRVVVAAGACGCSGGIFGEGTLAMGVREARLRRDGHATTPEPAVAGQPGSAPG